MVGAVITRPLDAEAARQRAAHKAGSVILQEFRAAMQAQRSATMAQPSPRAEGDRQPYHWGGLDWSDFVRAGLSPVGVNESTARAVSAVVACVNLIAGSIATVPLHFYREVASGGRERFRPKLWWLFNERPHPAWSAAAFWQYLGESRLFHGDAFARIRTAGKFSNEPAAFEPHHPLLTTVERADGRLRYTFWPRPDEPQDRVEVLDQDEVLHIPGPGFNGVRSVSQLQYGLRHAAGIALAADQQAGQFMADGARPDFAIEVPGDLDDEAKDYLRDSWLKRHSGQGAKKAPVVMTNGMKLHQLTLSMEDAQLLSTRSHQVLEVCRIFGVPPHMIGHTEKTTSWGSGIEQMSIGFVKYTLARHLVAIEQEINHKLFSRAGTYAQFLTAGLERGDIKTRFEAYRIALGRAGERPWMKSSEVRRLEDLPDDAAMDAALNPGGNSSSGDDPAPKKDDDDGQTPAAAAE